MNCLKDIITNKNIVISKDATIKTALRVINENKTGCVVLLQDDKAVGIITESDIMNTFYSNIDLNTKAIDIANKKIISTDGNRPIEFAFEILNTNNIKRLILIDKDEKYIGTVLQEDLFGYLESDVYKVDLQISSILDQKYSVVTVDIEDSIKDVLLKMQEFKIGSVVVMHDDKYVGIVTEKDIINVTYNEINFSSKISSFMSSPIITVNDKMLVLDAINIMQIKKIRRIVVVDENNELLSILTNRDILKNIKGNYTRILQNKIKHAQEIMNFLPEPIVEIYYAKDEDIIYWMNTQAIKTFGNNLIDKSITNIIDNDNWAYIKKILLQNGIISEISIKFDNFIYEISGVTSKNTQGNYIKLLFKDVTNYEIKNEKLQNIIDNEIRKRLESEYLLMQQSKLATMGEMIGHIAHQWRQPLSKLGGIFMNIESAYSFDELDKSYLQEKLKSGNELIKYMSNTIDDFKNFFEPNKEKEKFIIYDYIINALNIINASLIYRHIKISFKEPKKRYESIGYPSEFSQVILNILVNAQDAIISRDIKKGKIDIEIYEDENNIKIDIKDNGGGIDTKDMNKIFDIYFTTKSKKEGSGLGLYMSKLIIETKLAGEIEVQNIENGALFTISLPKV